MFGGKMKAVTFSYDDGVTQDIRLIEILNRYGLKCTFNINSDLLGHPGQLERNGKIVNHTKVPREEVASIYRGHEVAVHTLTHPSLPTLDEAQIIRQVEQDRLQLSELCGYEVVGMAYPGGGVNNDERVAGIIGAHTGVKYARTIASTNSFALQTDLLRFNPSAYTLEMDTVNQLADQFLAAKPDQPMLFYIWGHSFEFDVYDSCSWDALEAFCRRISGHDDVFYGTNREVLL